MEHISNPSLVQRSWCGENTTGQRPLTIDGVLRTMQSHAAMPIICLACVKAVARELERLSETGTA